MKNNLNKKRFGKSLSVNKDLNKGHVIEASDLETKSHSAKEFPLLIMIK